MAVSLEQLVAGLANRNAARTEAIVQADVRALLLSAPLDLTEEVLLESQVGDQRRIDVEVGATVIEVKKDLRVGNVRADAVIQLQGYVESRQNKFNVRYVGILTDGAEWRCYHLKAKALVEASVHVVSHAKPEVDALLVWLEGVLATARDLKPTPDEIRTRLGATSSSYALDRATLATLYETHQDRPSVRTKRRLWARLLETALGTQFEDSDALFVEHTLLVNSAEIIAHAVLGLAVENIVPQSLLAGTRFDESGIHGVVEADFFDWVVEVPEGDRFVRTLARRLCRFDWSAVEHDVLKVLYESIIGAETRKKLGEYYTPDWLAEQVVTRAVPSPLTERVLDPACGSGTFLFHAVRRYLREAEAQGTSLSEMLDGVTNHVFGMDLHPVAVTLARVTYLLAIGRERLSGERGDIRVPVFLGDSMQWLRKDDLLDSKDLTIEVNDQRELFVASEFRFPHELLKDTRRFDELIEQLAQRASKRQPGSAVPSVAPVLTLLHITPEHGKTIAATFDTMCKLHDEGRDHIWGYYIRNMARPAWLAREENRVDVLVGNPPWLSYRFMPEAMQKDFRALCASRKLWHGAKVATHQDLSGLFVARVLQLYLGDGGRFGFVMPDAALDRAQFEGFRAGAYPDGFYPVQVEFGTAWDLRRLRPHFFPRGSAVVFGRRAKRATALPSPPEVWTGRLPPGKTSWKEIGPAITRTTSEKKVSKEGPRSPYQANFRQGATLVPRVLFMVERRSAGPLGLAAGKASVRSVRSASEKKPWKELSSLEGIVETEFLRPVHLGATVLPFRVLKPVLAVLPVTHMGEILAGTDDLGLYQGLEAWWQQAEKLWETHREKKDGSKEFSLAEQMNFHGKLKNQFKIQPQRVVYSKSGMHLSAARLKDGRAVIDHTLYWATISEEAEAHYLCAVLNAASTTKAVRPFMSYGKDERHIDKHIWRLPIPAFDAKKALHAELSALGMEAEGTVKDLKLDETRHFASARRVIRTFLAESETGKKIEKLVEKLLK
ncbi:MAG: N-6 DNA methylase [Deltaproteobacteria bacterium]|nr:N-6 DNA methylase [Deltaproteobacteria bacterium]